MKLTFLVLLLCFAAGASAQSSAPPFHARFSGYYRSLVTSSHSWITGDAYGDSLNRLRLTFDARYRRVAALHIDYDNELHFGNFITQPDFIEVRDRQDLAYLDLIHAIVNRRHAYWDTSLYRGYMTVRHGRAELTAGRQRIAWGTAHFWSPADLFNPISPLQVEGDERQGVDAGQLALRLPHSLRWSLVYAPQAGIDRSTEASRLATTVRNFDVALLGGRFQTNWVAGGDFAGQWGGAGLRGELTYTARSTTQPDALRLTFGSDYALGQKWYFLAEYFYNQAQPSGYVPGKPFDPVSLLKPTTELYTLQRHFLSAGARYSLTPLIDLQTYTVTDLVGPGLLVLPSLAWNVTPNTDLTAGGQLFAASRSSDFTGAPDLFYLQLTVHF